MNTHICHEKINEGNKTSGSPDIDSYYQLNRKKQVLIFRLCTGHNRLRFQLFSKLKMGTSNECDCGTNKMT
uniref:Uncharacterized protein n=1 Tax=Arion vulgaris TaxID=1028688 RepID=A0A0B6Y9B0_9EUPU